jgi:UDP-N-acetyl-D-glucosamine dehydrogenase
MAPLISLNVALDAVRDTDSARTPAAPRDVGNRRFGSPDPPTEPTVAIVGLGYVGLPTGLALSAAGLGVIGIDVSERRLADVRAERADLLPSDRARLADALRSPYFRLTADMAALAHANAIVICVPTPVNDDMTPDLRYVRDACAAVVAGAGIGQTIILTSTTYVGTTRELLIGPLEARGFTVGENIFVAFSPERIDPGNAAHEQGNVPRVLGGATDACTANAASVLGAIAPSVHVVESCEAAELTKLYENTFRAVNIALANEMAGVSQAYGLDPIEITRAAATKPYGFLAHYPGAGVGGHCIPCDPHYLLAGLRSRGERAPLIERAMSAIAERPRAVARRAAEILDVAGTRVEGARILIVGVAYKPGVRDVRESPALEIIDELEGLGARIAFTDTLVDRIKTRAGTSLTSVRAPRAADYDLALLVTLQPDEDHAWLRHCERVLDCTYRTHAGARRYTV